MEIDEQFINISFRVSFCSVLRELSLIYKCMFFDPRYSVAHIFNFSLVKLKGRTVDALTLGVDEGRD